jgi:hypothetical protein
VTGWRNPTRLTSSTGSPTISLGQPVLFSASDRVEKQSVKMSIDLLRLESGLYLPPSTFLLAALVPTGQSARMAYY